MSCHFKLFKNVLSNTGRRGKIKKTMVGNAMCPVLTQGASISKSHFVIKDVRTSSDAVQAVRYLYAKSSGETAVSTQPTMN